MAVSAANAAQHPLRIKLLARACDIPCPLAMQAYPISASSPDFEPPRGSGFSRPPCLETTLRKGPKRTANGDDHRHREARLRPYLEARPDRALAARHGLLQAPDAADDLEPLSPCQRDLHADQPDEVGAARGR